MGANTVVVLGAGTGGVVAARELRRHLDDADRVVVVDRSPVYRFAPSFLWVLTGARRPGQVTRDLSSLRAHNIDVVHADVIDIDLSAATIRTTEETLGFDRLVIALGAELAPEALPGFREGAHNVYTLEGVEAARRALEGLQGGRIAVVVSSLPYKCPAAPYETAFLVDSLLRSRGTRDSCSIDVYTPEMLPMPTAGPVLGQALVDMLSGRGIGFHPGESVERVEPGERSLVFEGGRIESYDLLLGVPPHRAPAIVRATPLAAESGFIPVDRHTLATSFEGVYALGDVTVISIAGGKFLPKAGVFANDQAKVVARRIASELSGQTTDASFDGRGSCFVELGAGAAAFATGDFYAEGGPEVALRRPGRIWHLAKVAFEKYWMRRWL
ncbi:MAG TPA: FAD/NAD(P)-binding oxidoreductase [Actinomycetota bacterium]|nr:FAD/NAD(P)-binding oxidoreductase [Actinomycetota bacterium]